jgi:TPR repeat protein
VAKRRKYAPAAGGITPLLRVVGIERIRGGGVADKITNEEFSRLLERKAEKGDAEFIYRVAQCYHEGYNVDRNYDESIK